MLKNIYQILFLFEIFKPKMPKILFCLRRQRGRQYNKFSGQNMQAGSWRNLLICLDSDFAIYLTERCSDLSVILTPGHPFVPPSPAISSILSTSTIISAGFTSLSEEHVDCTATMFEYHVCRTTPLYRLGIGRITIVGRGHITPLVFTVLYLLIVYHITVLVWQRHARKSD